MVNVLPFYGFYFYWSFSLLYIHILISCDHIDKVFKIIPLLLETFSKSFSFKISNQIVSSLIHFWKDFYTGWDTWNLFIFLYIEIQFSEIAVVKETNFYPICVLIPLSKCLFPIWRHFPIRLQMCQYSLWRFSANCILCNWELIGKVTNCSEKIIVEILCKKMFTFTFWWNYIFSIVMILLYCTFLIPWVGA